MSTIAQHAQEVEVCPNCGDLVALLDDETGWCNSCAGVALPISCLTCGASLAVAGKFCSKCKYVYWLTQNADAIERVMASGAGGAVINASKAKKLVRDMNRPICLSCDQPIKGGQRDRHFFCTKTPHCIKAHNAYHYHRRVQNRSHVESLQRAITASQILKLTNEALNG